MNKSHVRLIKLIFKFSEQFNVRPPESLDILGWWKNALKEMDKETIDFIYSTFFDSNNEFMKKMKEDLIKRKRQLDNSGCDKL